MALVVGVTDKQRLLELLSDGRPHSHKEAYRLGLMAHSRAADLRKDGHDVQVWREGNTYWYRLALSEGEQELANESQSSAVTNRLASPSESATCHNCGGTDYRHVTDDVFRCNACNAQLPVSGVETAAAPEALFPDERTHYAKEQAA